MATEVVKNTKTRGHLNFKCGLVALSVTGHALENITDSHLHSLHSKIKQKLGTLPACNTNCSSQIRNTNRWCSTCNAWKKELQTYMYAQNAKISWDKMKSWEWPVDHRNIAEIFLPASWCPSELSLTDVSTILSIWQRCSEFPRNIVQFSKRLQRERNKIFHHYASKLVIEDAEKETLFKAIYKVIKHGDIVPFVHNHNEVTKYLFDLEQGRLKGHEETVEQALREIARTNEEVLKVVQHLTKKNKANRGLKWICITTFFVSVCVLTCCYFTVVSLNRNSWDATESSDFTGCLSEVPHRLLGPGIRMEGYLTIHKRFVGRKWLFTQLEQNINGDNISLTKHGVLLMAGMGYGKSAIISQIVCGVTPEIGYRLRQKVIAYHVCRFDALLAKKGNIFIKRITSMIASKVITFARILESEKVCSQIYDRDTCQQDPFGCLDQCLIFPLKKITFDAEEQFLIAIDALDECEDRDGNNEIFDLLKWRIKDFPSTFKFVVTSRHISKYITLNTELSVMELNDNDELNREDVDSYIHSLSGITIEKTSFAKIIPNFLLVSNVFESKMGSGNWGQIPNSLNKYYEQQFLRIFGNNFETPKLVFEIVCTLSIPPTESHLYSIISNTTSVSQDQLILALEKLQHFLIRIEDELHLSQMSLKYWLENSASKKYRLRIENGHRIHAIYHLKRFALDSDTDIVDITFHIAYAWQNDDLKEQFYKIGKNKSIQAKGNELPLHRLIKRCDCKDAFDLLQFYYSDINELNQEGLSPLYLSAALGRTNIFKSLIDKNADIHFRVKSYSEVINFDRATEIAFRDRHWGYGLLDIAAQNGQYEIVHIILNDKTFKSYKFYRMNDMHLLPIHLACKLGHTNIVRILTYHSGNMLDDMCLYFASRNGNTDLVKFVLGQGIKDTCRSCTDRMYWIPKNKSRVQGRKILVHDNYSEKDYIIFSDWSLIMCETALHAAVRKNNQDIVNILVSEQINALTCVDRAGRTPLISSIVHNVPDISQTILRRSVFDTNWKCQQTKDILDTSQLNTKEIQELKSLRCEADLPVLHIVAAFDRIWFFRVLGKLTINWQTIPRDSSGCHPAHIAACHNSLNVLKLISDSTNKKILDFRCSNGSTPLHSAALCGSLRAIEYLLQFIALGENVFGETTYLFSAIKITLPENKDYAEERIDRSNKIIELFIMKGFRINTSDDYGRNIFHYAISNGYLKVVSNLLDKTDESRMLLTARDIYGKIPLLHAIETMTFTNTVRLNLIALLQNSTMSSAQMKSILSTREYSCFITMLYMKNNMLLKPSLEKRIIQLLIQKQRFAFILVIVKETDYYDIFSDTEILKNLRTFDKSNILLPIWLHTYVSKSVNNRKGIHVVINVLKNIYCKENSLPCILHEAALRANFKTVLPGFLTNASVTLNKKLAIVLFIDQFSVLLKESTDYDGFNVFERAIQGRNIEFAKHLLGIGVGSCKKAEFLLSWVMKRDHDSKREILNFYVGLDNAGTLKIEIIEQKDIPSKLSEHMFSGNGVSFKRLQDLLKMSNGRYANNQNLSDSVTLLLLRHYRKHISERYICSPMSRNFSFIHYVSMQNFVRSMKFIEKQWGSEVLKCANYDNFTPLYLSSLFENDETRNYLESRKIQLKRPNQNAENHLIFKIWSRFLSNTNKFRSLKCIFDLRTVVANIYKGFKIFRCFKRCAHILEITDVLRDDLEELKSNVIYFSSLKFFQHEFRILQTMYEYSAYIEIPETDLMTHLHVTSRVCRVCGNAYQKSLYLMKKRNNHCRNGPLSILVDDFLTRDYKAVLPFYDFSINDCAELFSDSVCVYKHILIKRYFSSPHGNYKKSIEQILANIVKYATKYYLGLNISNRVVQSDSYYSGDWLWNHHLYTYMDSIMGMTFFKEKFLIQGGLFSAFLKQQQTTNKGLRYLKWSIKANKMAKEYTGKEKSPANA